MFAAGILADVADGRDVHVVLCTDGSATIAREELNDGTFCHLCNTVHTYALTPEQVTAARDDEFRRSCIALGVPAENVHINGDGEGTERVKDTHLDEDSATKILSYYLERFPNAKVGLISPLTGPTQHCDHHRPGRAATRLQSDGKIGKLDLFVEPYAYDGYLENGSPALKHVSCDAAAPDGYQSFLNSFNEYKSFDPQKGRYAVGYHSASALFDNPPADNSMHCYRSMMHRLVRYAGSSRYDTMREAVLDTWDASDVAVLVSGEAFPMRSRRPPWRGAFSRMLIVGGDKSVDSKVPSKCGIYDARRISGNSSYETCVAAARYSLEKGLAIAGFTVASGSSYADALVAATCAAKCGSVVLLVQEPYKNCSSVLELLAEKAGDIDLERNVCYAVGNTGALSEDLAETVVCAATSMSND